MIKVGIVGGTGYTGVELLRLLAQHPEADVRAITSRKDAGTKVADMFPSLRGRYAPRVRRSRARPTSRSCDVVFFATPHGVAMAEARGLVGGRRRRSSTSPRTSGSRIPRCSRSGTGCRTRARTSSPNRSTGCRR